MTLALLRINLNGGEISNVGHATSLADAAKQLMKMAKHEAAKTGNDAEVVHERDGYCVVIPPYRMALYTFEEVPF